jgi:hypothetical protein
MTNGLEATLPTKCLLHQALLWVAEEFRPVEDRIFLCLPDRSWGTANEKHKRDLLIALRSGTIRANGVLWVTQGPRIKIEDQCTEIKSEFWEWDRIEWEDSILWMDSTNSEPVGNAWKLHSFEAITVPTAALVSAFPSQKKSTPFALEPPSRARTGRRGRPLEYDWDAFYVEVVVRADLDYLPEKQAELEQAMAEWCSEHWGEVPGESTLRGKLSPIYSHPRKARK